MMIISGALFAPLRSSNVAEIEIALANVSLPNIRTQCSIPFSIFGYGALL
jgi:hypothetical protein